MKHILRQRSIAALLTSQVVSSFGTQMTVLALPWFVLETTGSPTRMGIVLAVEMLPVALLGIPSGTVVTRLGARNTMLVGDLCRAPILLSIPVLHTAGLLSFPVLLALVSLLGIFIAPYFASQRWCCPRFWATTSGRSARPTRCSRERNARRRSSGLRWPAC